MSVINERDWAAKTAMRLRIVQATMVESDSMERGREVWGFISEAIRELDQVKDDQRLRCMKALDEEFPFFDSRLTLDAEPSGENSTAVAAELRAKRQQPVPVRLTLDEMIQELVVGYTTMKQDEREKCSRRLAEAGFLIEQPSLTGSEKALKAPLALPVYEEEQVRLKRTVDKILEKLGTELTKGGGKEELNLTRCLQMLGLMSEQYLALHPQVWALWDEMVSTQQYTTSFNRPTLPAAQALAEFLKGRSTTRRSDVGEMVTKSFYLMNALVLSVSEAGREFAVWFLQKFGPENIQSLMNFETNGSRAGPAEYWQRYFDLAHQYNEEEMKEQFQKLLGKAMMRHLQRRPASGS